jgi:hypothetical protein
MEITPCPRIFDGYERENFVRIFFIYNFFSSSPITVFFPNLFQNHAVCKNHMRENVGKEKQKFTCFNEFYSG